MVKGSAGYLSYLLRLWRVGTGPEGTWHASLESIPIGERQAFASLDDLVAYLRVQARAHAAQEKDEDGSGCGTGHDRDAASSDQLEP